MRTLLAIALAVAAPFAAVAADQPATTDAKPVARIGMLLRDSAAARIGQVVRVRDSGAVEVIYDSRMIVIPGSTLSVGADGKLKTSLSKAELRKLK